MGRRAKRVGWGVAEQLFLQEKHRGFHLDRDWKKIEGRALALGRVGRQGPMWQARFEAMGPEEGGRVGRRAGTACHLPH